MSVPEWRILGTDFVWSDLTPDEAAARIASKHPYKRTTGDPLSEPQGPPPSNLVLAYDLGGRYNVLYRRVPPTKVEGVPYLVTYQYGVRHLVTGVETWAPLGSEYATRPDVTVNTVRNLCGIIDIEKVLAEHERKIASLEAQNRQLQNKVAAFEQQHVSVRIKPA